MTGRKARADRLCVLTVALALALAQYPAHWLQRQPNLPSGASYAFFEFAPASGAGMPAACSTTAPTGAKGEAMTFARGSVATCTKTASGGLATTGIANGDLVQMSSNVARVEYDSAGVLGLLVESSRTNSALRSEELDNAVWLQNADSAARNSTVTANQAVAPDGNTTADRLDLVATTGAQFSSRQQSAACPATAQGMSVYLKSVTTGDSLDLCDNATCITCTHVPGSWTRCVGSVAIVAAGAFTIGNMTVSTGTPRNAQSVYVWGLQCEAGSYATSYIPTTSAAVTRSEEAADFAVSLSPTAGMCVASSMNYPSLSVLGTGGSTMSAMATTGAAGAALGATYLWPYSSAVNGAAAVDTAGVVSAGSSFYQPGVIATLQGRYLVRHQGGVGNWTVCTNGSCSTQGTTSTWGTPAFTRLKVDRATAAAGNATAHIISRIQVDPVSTRCSP